MAKRVSVSVILQSEATDDGKILIKGSGRRGDVEIVLPGEAATMLIASIVAFLPKLAKVSASGTSPSFAMASWELKETNDPTESVRLYIRCAVPVGGPFEVIDLGFVMSWDQVAEMGRKLTEAAKNRPPARPPTRN